MPEMNHHHRKHLLIIRHGNCQKTLCKVHCYTNALYLYHQYFSQYTYGAVPDVQKHLLCLLWPTDYIREAGCFLRCHTVMWKSTLESCALHTYNKKTSCLQALQRNCYMSIFFTLLFLAKVSRIAMRWHGSWFHDMLSLSSFICFCRTCCFPHQQLCELQILSRLNEKAILWQKQPEK